MRFAPGLALLLAACAANPAPPASLPSDSSPSEAQAPTAEIAYTIELATKSTLEARFHLSCPAAADGATTLSVDESWGGVEGAGLAILDVRAADAAGKPLDVERIADHRWRVASTRSTRIDVSWRIEPNGHQADPDPRVHYRTLFSDRLLHLVGHLGLLVPLHVDGATPRSVALRWRGFAEAGWTVASSFGVDPRGFDIEACLDEVRHAVYLAAPDLRVHRREIRGRPIGVAIAGSDWSFTDESFVADVAAIVEAERAFFDDDDFPFYLVTAIPVGVPDPHSRSLGGTGLTRSFALFLQPDTPLGARDGTNFHVQSLLAHEMFHHWNGGVARLDDSEQLGYWFSEGFTVFYARRLLYRAGFGGVAEYARSLNETLTDYSLSPVRNESNERIREDFWKDRDVGKLPYLRGDLVAVLVDGEIRSRSGGTRSLDDFLRATVEDGRKGEKMNTQAVLARIEDWTDREFAARVRSIVVDGADVALEPSFLQPCFETSTEQLGSFDLGFDLDASRAAKEARGVRADSAAARAGLADGQRITGWSVAFGQPEVPVELTVRDGDEEKTIRWLPQGEAKPVLRVRAALGADCSWL